jgi:hypothetical protein
MGKFKDGGPAFPMAGANYTEDCGDFQRPAYHGPQEGMTLRDYFAAKAMLGLIAEPQWREGGYSLVYILGPQTKDDAENYAVAAYRLADAMLKARDA